MEGLKPPSAGRNPSRKWEYSLYSRYRPDRDHFPIFSGSDLSAPATVSRISLSVDAHPKMLLALNSLDSTFEFADRLCNLFQHRDTSRNVQQVRRVSLRWPISVSSPSLRWGKH